MTKPKWREVLRVAWRVGRAVLRTRTRATLQIIEAVALAESGTAEGRGPTGGFTGVLHHEPLRRGIWAIEAITALEGAQRFLMSYGTPSAKRLAKQIEALLAARGRTAGPDPAGTSIPQGRSDRRHASAVRRCDG